MKYLTNSGLSYFLNKIKTYIASQLNSKANLTHTHNASDITSGLATVATSGSYNDLSNKPTIPTVNNATLTIQKNGTTVKTFTANASSNVTANITVPTKTSELTNDSGFLTGVTWNDVNNKPSFATVATSGSYNDLSNKPTIPSKTSDLTNDSGYITSSGSCNYANSAGSATTAGAVSTSVADGSSKDLVYATMAGSDAFRIRCGGDHDGGWVEIATSDNGNEPIYVRQYNWDGITPTNFSSIVRTLTLLDGSGNTQFPGTVSAPTFSGNLNGNCSGTAGSVAWNNVSGKPSAFTPYFANGTWYAVGDDAAIGDHNVGGGLGVKALNSTTTRIDLCYKDDASNYKSITYDGTTLYMNGNCDYATSAGSAGSVAWGNVSGRPTALSQFTNDSGFLTSADRLPIGSYIQFAGSQAPAGFLVCNGGEISRTTYSALFAVIGTTYGSGNGSTTFNLPNLTDRFLQGSTSVGTVKNAGLPNITGYIRSPANSATEQQGAFKVNSLEKDGGTYGSGNLYFWRWSFNASRSSSIYGNSSTVQPPALTCLICIKY